MSKLSVNKALLKANSLLNNGQQEEAKKLYQTILKTYPNNRRAKQGLVKLKSSNLPLATSEPPQEITNNLIKTFNTGNIDLTIKKSRKLSKRYPNSLTIWNILGASAAQKGEIAVAKDAFLKVININPEYAEGHNNLGNILKQQGRPTEALAAFRKAISLNPIYADAFYNMGVTLEEHQQLDEALNAYSRAISIKPDHAKAFGNMGNVFKKQGHLAHGIAAYDKALSIEPTYAEMYFNKGVIFQDQEMFVDATAAYKTAIVYQPNFAEAYNNIGHVLKHQGKSANAEIEFRKAIQAAPNYAEAKNNLGTVLHDQQDFEGAIDAYKEAINIQPHYSDAYYNLGITLQDLGNIKAAIAAYEEALRLKPKHEAALTQKLHQLANICDWNAIEKDAASISQIGIDKQVIPPFALLSLEDAPQRHLLRSRIYANSKQPKKIPPLRHGSIKENGRLRIGYFSADFHNHATMYLMAKVFEAHNKEDFQIFAYSFGPDTDDEMRKRLINAVDVFDDVREMGDQEIAILARQDKLDIAVDLKGYTQNSRPGIFSYRAAPIQINYLGYPGTSGAPNIDYIIGDKIVIPKQCEGFYSEAIISLPNSYQVNDNTRIISKKVIRKSDVGLPDNGIVLCCFNNNYKITATEFEIWMRILKRVDNSVLWLLKSNKWAEKNLIKQFQSFGISSSRLVFADIWDHSEHLARQNLADLFLDTFNYNAHTTASDALWAGLPVITKLGEGFASRVAGSLLTAIGLEELITHTTKEYEELIIQLATSPDLLKKVKQKLKSNRSSFPLFDTDLFIKHLEQSYQKAHKKFSNGEPADNIYIN